jgi:hypothetical protein
MLDHYCADTTVSDSPYNVAGHNVIIFCFVQTLLSVTVHTITFCIVQTLLPVTVHTITLCIVQTLLPVTVHTITLCINASFNDYFGCSEFVQSKVWPVGTGIAPFVLKLGITPRPLCLQ